MEKSKTLALAVSAIKNLIKIRGSTSRDIVKCIKKSYEFEGNAIKRQVKASLRRGIAYGILKRDNGNYVFPMETENSGEEIAAQEIGLIDMCGKKRGKKISRGKNAGKCRGSNCKKCGKSCPCAKSNTSCLKNNNRRKHKTQNSRYNSSDLRKFSQIFLRDLKNREGRRSHRFY